MFRDPFTIKLLYKVVVDAKGAYVISVVFVCKVVILELVVVKSVVLAFVFIWACTSDVKLPI